MLLTEWMLNNVRSGTWLLGPKKLGPRGTDGISQWCRLDPRNGYRPVTQSGKGRPQHEGPRHWSRWPESVPGDDGIEPGPVGADDANSRQPFYGASITEFPHLERDYTDALTAYTNDRLAPANAFVPSGA